MHEATIARNIIEQIEQRIGSGDIRGRVRSVNVSVGRLTTIVPDNLHFLFKVLKEDTLLEGSELTVHQIPLRIKCEACRAEYELEDVDFRCIFCESSDTEILSGRELIIESVEVE